MTAVRRRLASITKLLPFVLRKSTYNSLFRLEILSLAKLLALYCSLANVNDPASHISNWATVRSMLVLNYPSAKIVVWLG